MKRNVIVLSVLFLLSACASRDVCVPEMHVKHHQDCTFFNKLDGNGCTAHVAHTTVRFEKKTEK